MVFIPITGEMNGFLLVPGVACGTLGVLLPGIATYCCLFCVGVLGIVSTGWYLGVGALYWGGSCLVGAGVWGPAAGLALYVWRLVHAIAGVSPVTVILMALNSV